MPGPHPRYPARPLSGHGRGVASGNGGAFTGRALDLATHRPARCVILQRPQARAAMAPGRDLDWDDAVATAQPDDCVRLAATDPLYILYTSGTTARPKGVVRGNGGHAVALRWTMDAIYDTGPGEVFWAASDVGWVVGHSYIVYAPLLAGHDEPVPSTIEDPAVLDALRPVLADHD
jgi:acyl-coenzyme A synthetase/AMP-(fatty) acid ligase